MTTDGFHAACLEILGQSHWPGRVAAILTPDASDRDFYVAGMVARDLGIDTFEVNVRRIEQDPLGQDWFNAWRSADTEQARRLVELARTRLPLAEIASGPGDTLGVGPKFKAHHALDWSLQSLRNHPGLGGDLLIIGLQSPVTRNRNFALRALQQWPAESWAAEARGRVDAAAVGDANEHTRKLAGRVLRGEPSE